MIEHVEPILTAAREFARTDNGQTTIEIGQYLAYVTLALVTLVKVIWPALALTTRVVTFPVRWAFRKPPLKPMSPLAEGLSRLLRSGTWTLEEFSEKDVLTCGRVQVVLSFLGAPTIRVDGRDIERLLTDDDRRRLKTRLQDHARELRKTARAWEAAKVLGQVRASEAGDQLSSRLESCQAAPQQERV